VKNKYQVEDIVRVEVSKRLFKKGYTTSFSDALFKIKSVMNTKPPTYKICTDANNPVSGTFYVQELSRVRKVL